jgi:hypothetical protein
MGRPSALHRRRTRRGGITNTASRGVAFSVAAPARFQATAMGRTPFRLVSVVILALGSTLATTPGLVQDKLGGVVPPRSPWSRWPAPGYRPEAQSSAGAGPAGAPNWRRGPRARTGGRLGPRLGCPASRRALGQGRLRPAEPHRAQRCRVERSLEPRRRTALGGTARRVLGLAPR